MTVEIVVMIIIGLAFIFASYFLSERLTKREDNRTLDLMAVKEEYEFSERELQIIRRKIEDVIAKQAKDILYETNESLNHMSNEKQQALGDYAVAVCEQIEKNHKEVMFLYSMLDDKQKEIMNTVRAVDDKNREVQDALGKIQRTIVVSDGGTRKRDGIKEESGHKTSAIDQLTALSKKKREMDAEQKAGVEQRKSTDMAMSGQNAAHTMKEQMAVEKDIPADTVLEPEDAVIPQQVQNVKQSAIEQPENLSSGPIQEERQEEAFDIESGRNREQEMEDSMDELFDELDETELDFDAVLESEFEENSNSNDIILQMHRNGNSIIEIAKQLGLGVGEVKLVIDLYRGE